MLVTLLGIVIEVRLVQPENAESLMFVTLLGMVIEVRLVQSENAETAIQTTFVVSNAPEKLVGTLITIFFPSEQV